jgi:UDP-glucose 4-epimerase
MSINPSYHPKYDVIFHLAAHARIQPSFEDPYEYLSNDIMGTARVCELARNLGSKVVYAGSSSAYGGPMLNPYSFAKYTGEQVCEMYHKVYGASTVTARFFNVYGPRQPKKGDWATVIGVFENLCLQRKPMTVTGDGEQRRDFTHIKDIVRGLVEISKIFGSGQVLNLGTGKNYSINDVARMFSSEIEYIDARPGEAKITQADISKTYLLTGWKPEISLSEYVESWKKSHIP